MIVDSANPSRRSGWLLLLSWQRLTVTVVASTLIFVLLSLGWRSSATSLIVRTTILGLLAMLAFGLFEQWPRRLPEWIGRWVLQVIAVAVTMPLGTCAIYVLSTKTNEPPFWTESDRLQGFAILTVMGLLVAPWLALAALVRQKDALSRYQLLQFELERSKLERQAIDARMNLLQAQVAPHFLFNTLANIKALVDTGSPQASAVLASLIAYLHAAVPRLYEPVTTLEQELQLVQAYLELMHMRIPDRLQFKLRADAAVRELYCPPISVLTLVENAVRHGIDPSEIGGYIEIDAQREGNRCRIRVSDSGMGLSNEDMSSGTGLANLRERLRLMFGDAAHLTISARIPHGVNADLDFPATTAPVP